MLVGGLRVLGLVQEVLGRGRLPGSVSRPGPLQSTVELHRQSLVDLRFRAQARFCAGGLTVAPDYCFRSEIPVHLVKNGARRSAERRNQEEMLSFIQPGATKDIQLHLQGVRTGPKQCGFVTLVMDELVASVW